MSRRILAIAFGIVVVVIGWAIAETVLALGTTPGYTQYDRVTRWSLRPGYEGPGPNLPDAVLDYTIRINSAGFRGAPLAESRTAGSIRLAAVGDSVTFGFGVPDRDTLPEQAAAQISERAGAAPVEVINAGVPGFSSLQGVRHLERRVLGFDPDIVVIFFGWNDGWRAPAPDIAWKGARIEELMQRSRVLGFVRRAGASFARRISRADPARVVERRPRVEPAAFAGNLRQMIGAIRAGGALPILITAPAAFGPDRPPDSYFKFDWTVPRAELEPLHLRYADTVRQVAEAMAVLVVDCARTMPADPSLFLADGYHPNREGFRIMSQQIVDRLQAAGAIETARRRAESRR